MKNAASALLVLSAMLSGMLGPSVAAAESEVDSGAVALLGELPPLRENVPAWVPMLWINEGTVDAEQFWVTHLDSSDLDVAFPAYEDDSSRPYLPAPGTYSSLFNDDVLSSNEMDFTAVQLTVTGPEPILDVRVSYLDPDGERVSHDRRIEVEIDAGSFQGDGVELANDQLGPVSAGSIAWLDLYVTAKTSVTDVELEVSSGAFGIVYPSDALFSGLNNGSTLLEGATDFGAVRFDTTGLSPGTYPIEVTATYKVGSQLHSVTVERIVVLER